MQGISFGKGVSLDVQQVPIMPRGGFTKGEYLLINVAAATSRKLRLPYKAKRY